MYSEETTQTTPPLQSRPVKSILQFAIWIRISVSLKNISLESLKMRTCFENLVGISNLAIRYSIDDLPKETQRGRKPRFPLELLHLLGRGSAADIPAAWPTADLGE